MQVPMLTSESKQRVEVILQRAAEDIEFRQQLLASPQSALVGAGFGAEEVALLTTLRRVALEEWGSTCAVSARSCGITATRSRPPTSEQSGKPRQHRPVPWSICTLRRRHPRRAAVHAGNAAGPEGL